MNDNTDSPSSSFDDLSPHGVIRKTSTDDAVKERSLVFEATATLHSAAIAPQTKAAVVDARPANQAGITELQMTEHHLKHGLDIAQAFLDSGLVASKSEALRLISQGGAYVNGLAVVDVDRVLCLGDVRNGCVMLRAKKKYARFSLGAVIIGQRSS